MRGLLSFVLPRHRRPRTSDGRGERGQAAFEFLLILPLFVLFILLLIDFGIVMYGYVSVANAAREGARFASVNCETGTCSLEDIRDRTIERSSGFITDHAEVTVSSAGEARGDSVAVTATRDHQFLFIPGARFDITSCAAMRYERDGGLAASGSGSCAP